LSPKTLGAYTGLLLVDGKPADDLWLIGAYPKWWKTPGPTVTGSMPVITKSGVLVKNALAVC
jgi:hypothetical protein